MPQSAFSCRTCIAFHQSRLQRASRRTPRQSESRARFSPTLGHCSARFSPRRETKRVCPYRPESIPVCCRLPVPAVGTLAARARALREIGDSMRTLQRLRADLVRSCAIVLAAAGIAATARAQEQGAPDKRESEREPERVIDGHVFLSPAFMPTPFLSTHFQFQQGVAEVSIADFPITENRTLDVDLLGLRERVEVGVRFADRFEVFGFAAGEILSGNSAVQCLPREAPPRTKGAWAADCDCSDRAGAAPRSRLACMVRRVTGSCWTRCAWLTRWSIVLPRQSMRSSIAASASWCSGTPRRGDRGASAGSPGARG